jgi:hypothetical protein
LNDEIEIPGKYFKNNTSYAAMAPGGGMSHESRVRSKRLGPLDFQTEFEVEPEMYSTLALDDQDKRNDAMQICQLAMGNPAVWNIYQAAKDVAATFRGRSNEDLVNPPRQPQMPPIKLSANLAIKFGSLPQPIQDEIFQAVGLPVDQTHSGLGHMNETLGGISQVASPISNLSGEPMGAQPEAQPPSGNGTGATK